MFLARIFTLYPDYFPGPLNKGLYGKAMEKKLWNMETVNIRDYATDKHKTVDDTTYGGGSGMLIKPDVLANSLDKNLKSKEKIIYLSPKGKLFNQQLAKELSKEKTVNLICGHFEGIDQRVIEARNIEEVSIGDFVLSGGESAAFVMLEVDDYNHRKADVHFFATQPSYLLSKFLSSELGSAHPVFGHRRICF